MDKNTLYFEKLFNEFKKRQRTLSTLDRKKNLLKKLDMGFPIIYDDFKLGLDVSVYGLNIAYYEKYKGNPSLIRFVHSIGSLGDTFLKDELSDEIYTFQRKALIKSLRDNANIFSLKKLILLFIFILFSFMLFIIVNKVFSLMDRVSDNYVFYSILGAIFFIFSFFFTVLFLFRDFEKSYENKVRFRRDFMSLIEPFYVLDINLEFFNKALKDNKFYSFKDMFVAQVNKIHKILLEG